MRLIFLDSGRRSDGVIGKHFQTTYERASHKVPHEIDPVLTRGRGHICLLEVGLHGLVEGEFFEERLDLGDLVGPFLVGKVWDRDGEETAGKFFAGVGVGVGVTHCA